MNSLEQEMFYTIKNDFKEMLINHRKEDFNLISSPIFDFLLYEIVKL